MADLIEVYQSIGRVLRIVAILEAEKPHSLDALLHAFETAQQQITDCGMAELEYAAYLAGLMRYGGK